VGSLPAARSKKRGGSVPPATEDRALASLVNARPSDALDGSPLAAKPAAPQPRDIERPARARLGRQKTAAVVVLLLAGRCGFTSRSFTFTLEW